jgi:hypothetical protein
MFAQVTRLQYWKSEHDEQTCEDAYGQNIADGLFTVADGAGTTLFSNIWARILVQSYLTVPLMSDHPFEVEWWVRRAQEQYKREVPDPGKMAWNALQKAQNQGSHSTLATLRVSKNDASHAQAELLVFGDSCIFIGQSGSQQVQSFPLETPSDFEQAPICVPSKLSLFNRYFHKCQVRHVGLEPGDVVVLATDAVSKWIISAANGRYTNARGAFQELIAQTSDTWATFVSACRNRGEMTDDDSTALILTLTANALTGTTPLGATTEHRRTIREDRKRELLNALDSNNKELMAIIYGDGTDPGLKEVPISQEQVHYARKVADALRDMLHVLRQEINGPDPAGKVGPFWQQYAHLLLEEPCAVNVRQTLARIGVSLNISSQSQPASTTEKGLDSPEPAKLQKEREQLNLERRFVDALRADDDEAILAIHKEIEQSLYTQNITFSPQEQQRIEQAYKRELTWQHIREALKSMNAEQMAEAYKLVSNHSLALAPDELNRLRIAHTFREAIHMNTDETILSAFEEMQHSSFYEFIRLTSPEEDRIGRAWRGRTAQAQSTSNQMANAPLQHTEESKPQQDETRSRQKRSWLARKSGRKEAGHA